MFKAFVKINKKVQEKKISYKNMFIKWKGKESKTPFGKVNPDELKDGLSKLKAGLSSQEIKDLVEELPFSQDDNTISYKEFAQEVVQGAQFLQKEKQAWIEKYHMFVNKFKESMSKSGLPLEKAFSQFDSDMSGGIDFEEFEQMAVIMEIDL